jgi:pimeloyl-ACP methyl ester carboxylesterase
MLTAILAAALAATPDSCIISREFAVPTPAGHTIAAVRESRPGAARQPAVVLISGAGAQTRDYSTAEGEYEGNRAFAHLSRQFVQAGFVVVRFDERGTGKSTGDYLRTATTASLAEDVEALLAVLARQAEVDSTRIALIGHSEGGAIAPLVAARQPSVGAIALLAAPSWTGRRIMDWQDAYEVRHGSWSSYRPDDESRREWLAAERQRRESTEAWFPFFLDYDPLIAIRRVRAPILILHGDADVMVTPEQALELAQAAREAGNSAVTVRLLPGHPHSLGEPAAFSWPPALSARVSAELTAWLVGTFGHRVAPSACDGGGR